MHTLRTLPMILYKGRVIRGHRPLGSWRRFALHLWQVPHDPTITYSVEYDGTAALRYLEQVRAQTGRKITLTHVFTKGIGLALARYPDLNARVLGGKIHRLPTVSMCIPSFVDGGKELHYFCIEDIDCKRVSEIADEIEVHAADADRRHEELSGHLPDWMLSLASRLDRFLVTRLDKRLWGFHAPDVSVAPVMFSASGRFARFHNTTGALFPGNTAIFILGTVTKKPVVIDDEIVIRSMIPFCMSADHRIIDGYTMSRYTDFLGAFASDPDAYIGDAV